MAKDQIADSWMRANGHLWDDGRLTQMVERDAARLDLNKAYPVDDRDLQFCYDCDERAYSEKLRQESAKRNKPFDVEVFVQDAIDAVTEDCIFVPFHHAGKVAQAYGETAYRFVCSVVHGPPKEGYVARHLCGNGYHGCINPAHLLWGTAEQNARDSFLHNQRPMFWEKLDDRTIQAIRDDGRHPKVIAVAFDLHAVTIDRIKGINAVTR